jgi:multidrug efflux pump subunit AcrA (membrane-fusion protein)
MRRQAEREEEARRMAEYEAEEAMRQAEYEAVNAAQQQAELEADEARRQAEYEEDLIRRQQEMEDQRRYEYEAEDEADAEPEEPEEEEDERIERIPDDGSEMDVEEFAQYACKYAAEIDCSISGKSMLALYERAEMMEEDGVPLTKANAEDLIEEAADKAEKRSFGGMFSSKYDKDGLLILKEKHFFD